MLIYGNSMHNLLIYLLSLLWRIVWVAPNPLFSKQTKINIIPGGILPK